jgi:DNA topoisomerase-6 subunit B
MASISIAEALAKKQREISVSEFFQRNKHILGYDSTTKALITTVKEGVDNAIDACEEARILPDVYVGLERLGQTEYKVVVEDNGPGIVKKQVANVFGRLLYGSRFHVMRQARGAQGLGISGVILYGQITTGKPVLIRSKIEERDVAYQVALIIDTKRNKPHVVKDEFVVWDKPHGTRIEVHVRGRYVSGKQSVYEYLRGTAIVNPHARIVFQPPDGRPIVFERATEELPVLTREMKPHPRGIELGTLLQMAKETKALKMTAFLETEFSRISSRVAKEICDVAGVSRDRRPRLMTLAEARALLAAVGKVRIMAPPTDGLSPIGEKLIRKGLRNVLGSLRPEFYSPPVTRDPAVYTGHPFQVEVGIVYGGDLAADQPVDILRFANRVPLLYQQGACATTAAIEAVDWRRYGLEQRGGRGIPYGPAIILVHVCSTKVPFTSEAKEAISPIPEITYEIQRALQECGRRLRTHLNKKARRAKTREKFDIVQRILPQIAEKSARVVGKPVPNLAATITKIMGVVWIDETVVYEGGRTKVALEVHNFTQRGKKLSLHAVLPGDGVEVVAWDPPPKEIRDDGKVTWELKRLPSVERAVVSFELTGLEEGEYGETELYVSGVNHEIVIGADPLPGDWDIKARVFEAEPVEVATAEEETEVDYDEVEAVAEDE